MLTYNLAGQFSGGSKRPPEATECITSLLVCPGYGICPRVTISQRRIPNDLSKNMKISLIFMHNNSKASCRSTSKEISKIFIKEDLVFKCPILLYTR